MAVAWKLPISAVFGWAKKLELVSTIPDSVCAVVSTVICPVPSASLPKKFCVKLNPYCPLNEAPATAGYAIPLLPRPQAHFSRSAAFTVSSLDEHSNLGKDHVRKFPAIRVAEDACFRNRTLIFGAEQCRAIRAGIFTHCRSRRPRFTGAKEDWIDANSKRRTGCSRAVLY